MEIQLDSTVYILGSSPTIIHNSRSSAMGRITSIISSATTLPSSKQLKRTRDSFSALANAVFLYWIWRYVCVEAYRYIRAKGLVGVGSDGVGSVKKVSPDGSLAPYDDA